MGLDLPQVGQTISRTDIPDTASLFSLFGHNIDRDVVMCLTAAALFFFGVFLSCSLRMNGQTASRRVFLASIPIFLVSSPAWAYTLQGNWGGSSIPLLDTIVAHANGIEGLPKKMFALGLIILLGMFSWRLMRIVMVFKPSAHVT